MFVAKFDDIPQSALLTKSDAIDACQMFSNGTLPYKRSHVKSLSDVDFTYKTRHQAPIQAWFGATLDYEKQEYLSDVTGEVIYIDNQLEFNATFWLVMYAGGSTMGLKTTQRIYSEYDTYEENILGRGR